QPHPHTARQASPPRLDPSRIAPALPPPTGLPAPHPTHPPCPGPHPGLPATLHPGQAPATVPPPSDRRDGTATRITSWASTISPEKQAAASAINRSSSSRP